MGILFLFHGFDKNEGWIHPLPSKTSVYCQDCFLQFICNVQFPISLSNTFLYYEKINWKPSSKTFVFP